MEEATLQKKPCIPKCISEFNSFIFSHIEKKGGIIKPAIFTHKFPDPDAIGSIMGMIWFFNKFYNTELHAYYDGDISHPQNVAISNLLDPQIKPIKEYNPENYDFKILVDTIPLNAGCHDKIFDIVIDHHKDPPGTDFNGFSLHMKTGSCCSIVYKIIRSFIEEPFDMDSDIDTKLATAMIAGIVTDTEFMLSDDTTELEIDAFFYLSRYRDSQALKQIAFYKRPKFWIDLKAAAVKNVEIDGEGNAVVGLGIIAEKQRDIISDMADEMVTWAPVKTAIVFAVVGSENVEGSVRSLNASLSVSDFCKMLGGKHGNGGGKLGKGAYRYSLAGMSIIQDEDEDLKHKTWEIIEAKERFRIKKSIKS